MKGTFIGINFGSTQTIISHFLVCLIPISSKMLGPTGLQKEEKEYRLKGVGTQFCSTHLECVYIIVVCITLNVASN